MNGGNAMEIVRTQTAGVETSKSHKL